MKGGLGPGGGGWKGCLMRTAGSAPERKGVIGIGVKWKADVARGVMGGRGVSWE